MTMMTLATIAGDEIGEFTDLNSAIDHLIGGRRAGVFATGGRDPYGKFRVQRVYVEDMGGMAIVHIDRSIPGKLAHHISTPWPAATVAAE
jgi:hypothetical protein